jgi:hypothetical protein
VQKLLLQSVLTVLVFKSIEAIECLKSRLSKGSAVAFADGVVEMGQLDTDTGENVLHAVT